MQKQLGLTYYLTQIKRVENYPDFEKLGTEFSMVNRGKYIEGKSTEANNPRHIL